MSNFNEEAYLDYIMKDPYLNFVAKEAQKSGKLFYIDSGEGHEYIDPKTGWAIEDLSGWLINPSDKERFIVLYGNKNSDKKDIYTEFSSEYIFVKWSMSEDSGLKIIFKNYGSYYD